MPQSKFVVKSINELADTLRKSNVKGNINDVVDNTMFKNNGTGSLIIDLLAGKRAGKTKVMRAYNGMQRKLSDVDMKVGGKAYDLLDKRKSSLARGLKNSLLQEHDFLTDSIKGSPNKYIKVNTTGILNPVSKSKNAVLPLVGTFALADAISSKKENGGGEVGY